MQRNYRYVVMHYTWTWISNETMPLLHANHRYIGDFTITSLFPLASKTTINTLIFAALVFFFALKSHNYLFHATGNNLQIFCVPDITSTVPTATHVVTWANVFTGPRTQTLTNLDQETRGLRSPWHQEEREADMPGAQRKVKTRSAIVSARSLGGTGMSNFRVSSTGGKRET